MMSNQVAISVHNVHKSFRLPHERYNGIKQALINFRFGKRFEEQHVLRGVSFEIKKGEFFGIVGRNGSGKSTLLKVLAQIYTTEQGGVTINGSLTPFIELGVGFNPELTGRENVYLNGALLGFDHKQVDAMYQEIVDFAELHEFMDQKLKNYSSGMQVRLAFSVAIRAKTDILLIDEVLAVGDAAFQQKCYRYFEELKRNNTTVVLVTHDMSAVRRFCTRAIMIEGGKVITEGSPSEVASSYTLENIETGQKQETNSLHNPDFSVEASKHSQSADALKVLFNTSVNSSLPYYLGISILKDGISIAEMNTSKLLPMSGSAKASYSLDLAVFNPGIYELSCALFGQDSKALLGAGTKTLSFQVPGEVDDTKSGAIKLGDDWNMHREAH